MTRNAFQQQLEALNQELMDMGRLVQEAIAESVMALVVRDGTAAQRVIEGDRDVNAAYYAVERRCLELLALQQPMASDLRQIASTLKVITDLERMADHSVEIARVAQRVAAELPIKPLVDIPLMATLVQEMVKDALAAFVSRDKARALAMAAKDHEVDRLLRLVIEDVRRLMEQDSKTVGQGIQLLFVARSLERIGDYATNLAEWLVFVETGERTNLNQ